MYDKKLCPHRDKRLWLEDRYRVWSAKLDFWRLCGRSECRRVRHCRGDMMRCGLSLAEWAKLMKLPSEGRLDPAELEKRTLMAKAMECIADKWRRLVEHEERLAREKASHYVPG